MVELSSVPASQPSYLRQIRPPAATHTARPPVCLSRCWVLVSLPGMFLSPPHTIFLPQITAEDHHCRSPPGAGDTGGGAALPGRLQAQGRDQGEAEGDPAQRPDGGDGREV